MKEKLTLPLRSAEESTVNQNSFRVLSILYITKFCETRKINSHAIRALFLLRNFWKSRKCALNQVQSHDKSNFIFDSGS